MNSDPDLYEKYICTRMEDMKNEAFCKLSDYCKEEYVSLFANKIAEDWFNDDKATQSLVDHLSLNELHMLSIQENYEDFEYQWQKENDELYGDMQLAAREYDY